MAIILAIDAKLMKRAGSTRGKESGVVLAAEVDGIKGIVQAVEPQHLTREAAAFREQPAVHRRAVAAAFAQPAADNVQNTMRVIWISPRPRHRKNAAARNAANQDRADFDIWALTQSADRGADIIQCPISARK